MESYNTLLIALLKGGRDLQIVLDAVCSKDGILGTQQDEANFKQSVPVYFSNVSWILRVKDEWK